jgi:S-adenosylmethionine hydrolase
VNAAVLLEYVIDDLPRDSVLLLVVDPKVGAQRRIIAVETVRGRIVLAPDRGLVNDLDWERARYVTNEELARSDVSSTFHGRDWFAPAGSYLSRGGAFDELGPIVEEESGSSIVPQPTFRDGELVGRVLHVDRFGNLITNVNPELLEETFPNWQNNLRLSMSGETITKFVNTYDEGNGPVGLVGSFEQLEVAVPGGSAAGELEATPGTELVVTSRNVANC